MASQRERFVEDAYRQAREAGLNDTQARLAASQAALETGYGKSVVGNNYFGIKAGSSWNGPSVTAGTWEDTANGPVRETARFRSYENPSNAFGDWARTVGSRWSNAFNAPTFNEAVSGLNAGQPGGYATDRHYGSKLRSINARYGPQAEEVDGIMSAINPPASATPMARPMSLAEQYGLLDQARGLNRDIGLLSQDVAAQDPMGQLRRDLIAREKAYKMATAPAGSLPLESLPPAPVDVPGPATTMTAYDQPQVAADPFGSVMAGTPSAASASAGLLSPEEYDMVRQQQMNVNAMGPNRGVQLGNFAKGALTRIGGGLLGGALLGPIGMVAGGLLAPKAVEALTAKQDFPSKPKNTRKGNDRLTEYGERVRSESRQFDRAMSRGGVGLY